MGKMGEMQGSVYEQPKEEVDGSQVSGMGNKGEQGEQGEQGDHRVHNLSILCTGCAS
jgi:hypothetical protein